MSLVSLPLADLIRLVWSRITLSRITVLYFVFSFLHASLQIILQADVFVINSQATNLVNAIVVKGNATTDGFSVLQRNELLWCNDPTRIPGSCIVLWNVTNQAIETSNTTIYAIPSNQSNYSQSMTSIGYSATSVTLSATASFTSLTRPIISPTSSSAAVSVATSKATVESAITKLPQETSKVASTSTSSGQEAQRSATVTLITEKGEQIVTGTYTRVDEEDTISERGTEFSALEAAVDEILDDPRCLTALLWPLETLRNTKREDIVFLNFHVWVLSMSIVAILNESLVHMYV
jgi:hypothetical protein